VVVWANAVVTANAASAPEIKNFVMRYPPVLPEMREATERIAKSSCLRHASSAARERKATA
jgi:hypothetical protein